MQNTIKYMDVSRFCQMLHTRTNLFFAYCDIVVVFAHLVITYCWANFIFPISSAKSEFNSFCAISICSRT